MWQDIEGEGNDRAGRKAQGGRRGDGRGGRGRATDTCFLGTISHIQVNRFSPMDLSTSLHYDLTPARAYDISWEKKKKVR